MLRPDSNFERDILRAFRWDPRNLPYLNRDWIGRGFGWDSDGVEVTIAPFDYKRDQLWTNVTLPPTLNANEGVLFEELGFLDGEAFGELFDNFILPYENQLDFEAVAYWKIVAISGGKIYRATKDAKGAIGQFPHTHVGALEIDWTSEIAIGETFGFDNLTSLSSSTSSTSDGASVTEHTLLETTGTIAAAGELSRSFEVKQGRTANIAFKVTPASASTCTFKFEVFREVNGTRATLADYAVPLTRTATTQVVVDVSGFGPGAYQAVITNTGTVSLNSSGVYKQDI